MAGCVSRQTRHEVFMFTHHWLACVARSMGAAVRCATHVTKWHPMGSNGCLCVVSDPLHIARSRGRSRYRASVWIHVRLQHRRERRKRARERDHSARSKGERNLCRPRAAIEAKYTVESWLRVAPAAVFAYHDISGVPGLADRRQAAFQGLSFETRFLLVDRERAPFGLMFSVEPHWNGIDDVTGQRVEDYGATLLLAADRELVSQKLYAAINVFYEPEATRVITLDRWMR